MSEKRNVLILIYSLRRGGIEMSAIQFQIHSDPSKYHFIYYLQDETNNDAILADAVKKSGAKIISKPKSIKSRTEEYRFLKALMKEENIHAVHDHMMYHGGISTRAAYYAGIKNRIVHSHLSKDARPIGIPGKLYQKLMRHWILKYATACLACSEPAGHYLYGNAFRRKGTIINNGIDMDTYRFDLTKREQKRNELGIPDGCLVVGHIGLIYWIKNQTFLVRVFRELLKIQPNAMLLLCGESRDDGECEQLVKDLGITESVRFLGSRSDIPELLMAMDVLAFPSVMEALPLVPLEAQATKLPCLISDRVNPVIQVNENVTFSPLEATEAEWAKQLIRLANGDRNGVATASLQEQYDINRVAKKLDEFYTN